jgi:chemotaxis protein methyltransferase CheR
MRAVEADNRTVREDAQLLKPLVLKASEFSAIAMLARRHFGVELGPGKEQLVTARLSKLMRRSGFSRFRDFFENLQSDRTGESLTQLIDALTTNHTSFFREREHFDFLIEDVFPHWKAARPMRIWSAASSTGEEPYTIAVIGREYFGSADKRVPSILASDISSEALKTARAGIYRSERIQGMSAPWLQKYLLRGEGRWEGWCRMRPEVMAMIEFRRINLIESLPGVGTFDVVFCRNVMIYFSRATQAEVVERLAACLTPGGYLFVGHSESLTGMQHGLEHIQPAIYRKRGPRV